MPPETRYAKSGDVNIAYQVVGEGPRDLVLVPGWVSNIEVFWDEPSVVHFFERLASFCRLILFDKRGTGLSDRVGDLPSLETRMDDVRAVMDAVGSARAALLGYSEGGPMCALFSATYPDRTSALIMIWVGNADAILDEIEEFLTGVRHGPEPDRVLATILFTDIVGATERAATLGDRRWRELLEHHHAAVRRELGRFRGREVDTAGDGFLATFDGPARAIRCACAAADAVRPFGLAIRAGLHTGEVEVMGEKLGGIAVHIGARVAAQAAPGEVLVSSTVKDLVAGSGLCFADRGLRMLKGVPGEWRLFAVERA